MLESVTQKSVIPSFEHFVGDISVRLLGKANVDIDRTMNAVMEDIGERYGVDRVALRWIDLDQAVARPSAIWQRDSGVPVAPNPLPSTPWVIAETLRGNTVCIETPDDFPATAAADREFVESEGIKALFLTPLIVDDDLEGALILSARDEFRWTDEIRTEVGSLAPIIAYAYWGNSTRAKLRDSEARYRAIVQDQTDLIVRWQPDGTIIWVNDFCCQHYQRPRDELVGRKLELFRAQDDWLGLIESIRDLTPQNSTISGEYPHTSPSNSIVWEEWGDTGIFDNTGTLIEIQSVGRDVTARRLAYDALRESETRYRDLVESSTDLIWESDLKLEHFFSNRRLETILGYPDRALQGVSIDDVLHADDLKKLREDLPTLAAAGKGWQRRLLRSRHKDGTYRYLESTATPIFDDSSVVCGFRGVDRDVSGEYFAAEEIRSKDAFISTIFSVVNDAIYVIDDETIIDCNAAATKLTGATRDMIIGRQVWGNSPEYQPDGTRSEDAAKTFLKNARNGQSQRIDWVADAADGSRRYSEITLNPLQTRNGLRIIAIVRDTTKLRQANEQLERRANLEARLAGISRGFLNAAPEHTDRMIRESLASIGGDYVFDRANITWFDDVPTGFRRFIDWMPADLREQTKLKNVALGDLQWGLDLVRSGEIVRIASLDQMPEEAALDRAYLAQIGYASVLSIPLRLGERIVGACTFCSNEERHWEDTEVDALQLLANTLTNAAIRQWSAVELSRREKDLARSQNVARVGSFRLQLTENDDGSLNILNLSMSDEALKIFDISPHLNPREQILAAVARIHPEDAPRVPETWRKTLRERSEHVIEYRIIRPDGSITHVQAMEQFVSIDSKGVITAFGTYKDITQWVEANQKLQSALSQIKELRDQLQEENVYLRDEIRAAHGFDRIIGESGALKRVLAAIEQVAPTDITVLVTGETGTGKELVSQSIHDLSPRKNNPMISVNCAALSAELIESELFGHEKGAFTGANQRRKGRFELADGGTLFLDEIGELSGELQAKLLRVIQEGEFERLGGSKTLRTDVRLIAATNRNLQRSVDEGEFRADLFYRINSFPIHVPPLREREGDIPLLTEFLVRKHADRLGKEIDSISTRTLRYLQQQTWPGNIRELEGTIIRALISTTGPVLDYSEDRPVATAPSSAGVSVAKSSLLDAQRSHIVEVLEQTRWVIEGERGAAAALGLAPSSLRSKMKRLDIVRPSR